MKKILSAVLAGLIAASALSLAGCSGSSSASSAAASSEAASSEAASSEAASSEVASDTSSAAASGATWDTADLSWKKHTDPVTMTCYIDYSWYAVDKWGNDEISKEITKETGVSLQVTKGSDHQQLLALLASDQLPELIFGSYQANRYYDPDVCMTWDELTSKYCPEFMEIMKNTDPVAIINNTQDDGHIYTFKTHFFSDADWADPRCVPSCGDPSLAWRSDLLKQYNIAEPTSVEELEKAFETVHAKDPNIICYLPDASWPDPVQDMMGLCEYNDYVADDGTVKYQYDYSTLKDFLLLEQSWYQKGYIPKEASTYTHEQWQTMCDSGKVFAAGYNYYCADTNNANAKKNGKSYTWAECNTPLTYKGQTLCSVVDGSDGWASFFITKNCKNPERAIDYAEFLRSPYGQKLTQWGVEGQDYTIDSNGIYQKTAALQKREAAGEVTGIGPWYFQGSALLEAIVTYSGKTEDGQQQLAVEALKNRKNYYKRIPALSRTAPAADSDEFTIKTKLDDLFTKQSVAIKTAASADAASKLYDDMMAQAKTIGLETLEKYYTDAYNKAKDKYTSK